MLTPQQKEKYIEDPFSCPFCGTNSIESGMIHGDDGATATAEISCLNPKCEKKWQETYTLTGVKDLAEPYEVGATVIVPEPDETDIHQHSFTGTLIGYRHGHAQVQDGDDDVFEIEPERLIQEL